MAGPDNAMKLEQAYLTALQQTFGYTLDSDTLTLFGVADQVMAFTAA
jgi:heat shock protein HslJ